MGAGSAMSVRVSVTDENGPRHQGKLLTNFGGLLSFKKDRGLCVL